MLLRLLTRVTLALVTLSLAGCDCAGTPPAGCDSDDDCGLERCIDGRCVPRGDGGGMDGGERVDGGGRDAGGGDDAGPCTPCGAACCAEGEVCVESACVTPGPECTTSDDCLDDAYCHESGRCLPYGVPPTRDRDPSCNRFVLAGVFAPTLQCAFDTAPAGDAFPSHVHVLSTPLVVDFGIGRRPGEAPRPSIVAVFDDGVDGSSEQPTGVIRILDGATCALTAELGSLQLVSHSSPPAVGDLTGDGRPEIVAYKAGGGLVAFGYDDAAGAWSVLWRSTLADGVTAHEPTGGGWAGPSLVDLDDDGVPEILRGGLVYGADGRLIDGSIGQLIYSQGIFGVVADVDADGNPELVAGHSVWEWDRAASAWTPEPYFAGGTAAGHVALADFGHFPGRNDWPAQTPEVAVISAGQARVQTLDGTLVFGPVAIPGGGTGGPPTIADFDGDGRPEFSLAGANALSVFDLDCTPAGAIGTCGPGRTDGVLWSQPAQDQSSNVTGSSVFDFEGDGRAEVVYGDECFLRVYDGQSGDVLFSQARSSCTWYENPVIADVDGDFNAEIVIGDNFNCGPGGSAALPRPCDAFGVTAANRWLDPIFAGLRCGENADCVSGRCQDGFCRCSSDAECCAGAGCASTPFYCAAPPAGTPGIGDTCRSARPTGTYGIRVYRDAADRWVRSRRIWNQHAYFVTNVSEAGVVPTTSAMSSNWLDPALNNFRQNDQGSAVPDAAPDLTARGTPVECGVDGAATLRVNACNRGTESVGGGLAVGFYVGDPRAGGTLICRAYTTGVLDPGACEAVSCAWPDVPTERPGAEVWARADDESERVECNEGNNLTVFGDVHCPGLG
ncbi:MAG: hypothetical protein KF729_18035 [Sandaracinaceae bacterium]|nr:hypothetical protein [Sandaracinaceae bacterium]